MSIWNDRPTGPGLPPSFRIMRTPAKGGLSGIVLSDELVGTQLHYFRGRSRPCTGDLCDPCKHGQLPRWKGYVFLKSLKTPTIGIFEFTERGFGPFDAYYTEHGTLRGAVMHSHRLAERDNGPLEIRFEPGNRNGKSLPNPTDLRGTLLRMWEVNEAGIALPTRGSVHDETAVAELNGRKRTK